MIKTAVLAGGLGSRLGAVTEERPKPLVEIGSHPMLWHIMTYLAHAGMRDFVIALGYKGDVIKRYFDEPIQFQAHLSVDPANKENKNSEESPPDVSVELIDTGLKTQTGGRILRLKPWLENDTFCLCWGDGLHNVDMRALLAFHRAHQKLATVVAVRPPARFGHLEFDGDRVVEFSEKPQAAEGWINGGVFVLEPGIFTYIKDDKTHWEHEPMRNLAADGQLMAFRHQGFWQCMDTPRDLALLNRLWQQGNHPWNSN